MQFHATPLQLQNSYLQHSNMKRQKKTNEKQVQRIHNKNGLHLEVAGVPNRSLCRRPEKPSRVRLYRWSAGATRTWLDLSSTCEMFQLQNFSVQLQTFILQNNLKHTSKIFQAGLNRHLEVKEVGRAFQVEGRIGKHHRAVRAGWASSAETQSLPTHLVMDVAKAVECGENLCDAIQQRMAACRRLERRLRNMFWGCSGLA